MNDGKQGRITDELREYVSTADRVVYTGKLLAIADRIEAAHEEALSLAYMDAKWLRLPKDIDDKSINEHDKVDWRDRAGRWHENATVVAVCNDGCYVMDRRTVFHVHKSDIRHHSLTVEDVLRDCIANVCRANAQLHEQGVHPLEMEDIDYEADVYISEYAEKLRLAGDAE